MKKIFVCTAVLLITALMYSACPQGEDEQGEKGVSAVPSAAIPSIEKQSTIQPSIDFTLSSTHTGTWKVYRNATTSTAMTTVTVAFAAPVLTLTAVSGDIVAGIYYVTVTESGKGESPRLALTVEDHVSTVVIQLKDVSVPMIRNGGLHTDEDFNFIKSKIAADEQPWFDGWGALTGNSHAQATYNPNPVVGTLYRGTPPSGAQWSENYARAFNDVAAAYQLALRWKISGDNVYANKAVQILNGWAASCTGINGTNDRYLASGIYGYQFAIAGELMRGYPGWTQPDFAKYQQWMLTVFYSMNRAFLTNHVSYPLGTNNVDHYWANWDLCNLASEIAIAILCDRRDIYNHAVDYLQKATGPGDFSVGNGSIKKAINYIHFVGNEELGQTQESGRDQGHTQMVIGLLGIICQLMWNQGDDLFSFDNNRFLRGCEYVAKYNYAGMDVPFTRYDRYNNGPAGESPVQIMTQISSSQRVDISNKETTRPVWALPYYHYSKVKGLGESKMTYTKRALDLVHPEGGGGDYNPNSGGYDQLGFGTLMYAK